MKKLSINDIAQQLNISKTTVSFILNNRAEEKRISAQLVKRVEEFIKEVGYKPNPIAKSLRTGKTNIIGLMVENIADPFFSAIARHIENKAYKNGYKIIYCSTDNNTEKTKELLTMFRDRNVDGCIIAPPEGVEAEISDLLESGMPVVFFDRHLEGIDTDQVEVNNYESTYEASRLLIKEGFKEIGFITFSSAQTQMQGRLEGYKAAMQAADLNAHILEIKFDQDEALIIGPIAHFLKEHKNMDAVLFSAIQAGTNGLKAFQQLHIRVPEDLAVIAFDDCDLFELYTPSITAIYQPIDEIAEATIDLLLNRLKKKTPTGEFKKVIIETGFTLRNSSHRI
ncbi:MAG TPA: substrate-binding domain-containing protein [Arachidicoccus sp.]|nr:substrate-binding domain-containing protein [Arachidicoccus sp.]